ncbi:hypothetical protein [Variovorax sp. dw_308]|uniref:hypothetical protein n=1 Tax=Variovorax sp. dw_308 TaxID=2721546 RepID=UPI001C47C36B|nr:hypothetical protein [Variovorax sp. dw_308]
MNMISNRQCQHFSPRRAQRQVSLCVFAPMIAEGISRYAHMALPSHTSLSLALKVGINRTALTPQVSATSAGRR